MEEWRDIKGYEGLYQVSNLGRVKSLGNSKSKKEKILKPYSNIGYFHVILSKEGIHKNFQVHRLVAEAFIPNQNNYPIINHKDENKQNNKVDNLEWCTYKYNNVYGTRIKRASEKNRLQTRDKIKGSKHPKARKVQCITTGRKFNCIKEAAEYYSISRVSISACCRGKYKYCGTHPVTGEKLKWKYID